MAENEVRLYISIPSNRDWKGKFGICFAGLVHYLTARGIKGHNLTKFYYNNLNNTSAISMARQSFVDEMLAGDFTHWLSLDDDMTFPRDICDHLMSHGKDIVTCNARLKTNEITGSCQDINGKMLDSTGKSGLEELKTMGGAIFLAKIDAFKHIPKPHFQIIWSPEHQAYVGEDVYFSTLLTIHGVQLWCDHDASQQIGHVGEQEYRFPWKADKLRVVA